MLECSVYNQYRYYCDLFCFGPASRFYYCHFHMWVRYIDTTKIMVLKFVWDCSDFTKYSYYCDFLCLGQYCVLVIAIITGERGILILQKIRFGVCHCWYCILVYDDSIILLCFILNWPMVQWWNYALLNGVMVKWG